MIHIVIGAQFGDEGKGRVVDALSAPGSLVVRFNGGAQAGHTVIGPDGKPHVFSHFGAGTFRQAPTLLSKYFIVNPILFVAEYQKLEAYNPTVYVDPEALVTTPYDMLLNRAAEDARGTARHGSCGLGINETVTRDSLAPLRVKDLFDPAYLLATIRDHYVPARARELGVPVPTMTADPKVMARFLEDIRTFNEHVIQEKDHKIICSFKDIVFEGAQGLRLDEVNGTFPYVTRSRTGTANPLRLLIQAGRVHDDVKVHYVTRTYTTRHGAGPLTDETNGHPYGWTGYETNVTNAYQGSFRYASLNVEELDAAIATDFKDAAASWTRVLDVTCLDQHPNPLALLRDLQNYISMPCRFAPGTYLKAETSTV